MLDRRLQVVLAQSVSAVHLISVDQQVDSADLYHRLSIPLIYHSAAIHVTRLILACHTNDGSVAQWLGRWLVIERSRV